MKKNIKLAVVAALALGATSAFATNGDNLINTGTQSRAMGGVGIAKSFGAESGLSNPALLSSVKNSEVAGSLTFFMPSVSFASDAASVAGGNPTGLPDAGDSTADFNTIPEVAFASRINKNMVYGFSLTGTAGMGVDYSANLYGTASDNGSFEMKTELSLLKVAIPFAYQMNDLSIGVTPLIHYGTLQMSHQTLSGPLASPKSSDTSFGYELGLSYDLSSVGVKGLTVGAVYKSKLKMTYDDTIASSIDAFGGAANTGVASGDKLDQPAEFGIGASYTMGENTVALDYRNVAWSDADGYADFGWEDQTVIAVGYEYATSKWAVRLGYNSGSSPIAEQDANGATAGTAAYGNGVKNFFNLAGFPGIVESHFTFGGGYAINDSLTFDGAVVMASETTETFDTSGLTQGIIQQNGGTPTGTEVSSAEVTHSQLGVSLGLSYKF